MFKTIKRMSGEARTLISSWLARTKIDDTSDDEDYNFFFEKKKKKKKNNFF